MSRTDAIARAHAQFQSGAFLSELDRRVAYKTESQNAERGEELRGYLQREMQPALADLDFTSRLVDSPGGSAPLLVAEYREDASAPTVLMYPLFMVIFGRSASTIIVMGFVAGLPPVILKTIEGLAATPRVLINVGRSFKLTGALLFIKILLPAALPTMFVGVRLGLIFALINVVGVEYLINFGGLGQLINDLAERYDLPGTYAAISFVILVSVCFFILTEWIERWLRPV